MTDLPRRLSIQPTRSLPAQSTHCGTDGDPGAATAGARSPGTAVPVTGLRAAEHGTEWEPPIGIGHVGTKFRCRPNSEVPERSNKTVSTSGFFVTGDRGFESFPLHRGVSCEPDFTGQSSRPIGAQAIAPRVGCGHCWSSRPAGSRISATPRRLFAMPRRRVPPATWKCAGRHWRSTGRPWPDDRRVLFDRYPPGGCGDQGRRHRQRRHLVRGGADDVDRRPPVLLADQQANASVLEAYAGKSVYAQQGERVVRGQRPHPAAEPGRCADWLGGSVESCAVITVPNRRAPHPPSPGYTAPNPTLNAPAVRRRCRRAHERLRPRQRLSGFRNVNPSSFLAMVV